MKVSRADAASIVRAEVFEDTDLPPNLKLFALAAIHLYEHADEYKQLKQFRRSPWPYRALRLAGRAGTDEELYWPLRSLIMDDVPKFRVGFTTRPACVGVMLRPAGAPCTKRAYTRTTIPNPINGERRLVGACSNPRHREALALQCRQARDAWKANGSPEPKPNSGGLLLRYFSSGIEELYAWADKDYRSGDVVPEMPAQPLAPVINLTERRKP